MSPECTEKFSSKLQLGCSHSLFHVCERDGPRAAVELLNHATTNHDVPESSVAFHHGHVDGAVDVTMTIM